MQNFKTLFRKLVRDLHTLFIMGGNQRMQEERASMG